MSVWDSIVGQQAVVGQLQAIVSGDPKTLADVTAAPLSAVVRALKLNWRMYGGAEGTRLRRWPWTCRRSPT